MVHESNADEFSDGGNLTAFFNELGSGSPTEVPEGSTEDDDASFEKQQQVECFQLKKMPRTIKRIFISHFSRQ